MNPDGRRVDDLRRPLDDRPSPLTRIPAARAPGVRSGVEPTIATRAPATVADEPARRRSRWPLPLLVPLALGALLWATTRDGDRGAMAAGDPSSGPPATASGAIPPPIGTRTDEGLDVVLLLDESGSTSRSDPRRYRVSAASRAVSFLRGQQSGQRDRVGVVRFADWAVPTLGLTPVATGLAEVEAALASSVPSEVGSGTRFVPALTTAADVLGPPVPGRRRVVILFTDGVVERGEDFAQIGSAIEELGSTNLHLVLLDELHVIDMQASGWSGQRLASTFAVSDLATGPQFEEALGRVLVEELGLTWGGAR